MVAQNLEGNLLYFPGKREEEKRREEKRGGEGGGGFEKREKGICFTIE